MTYNTRLPLDIFIVVRSGARYLDRCLRSLAALDYSPATITVLDPGTEVDRETLGETLPGVKFVRLPAGISPAAALNRALAMRRGDASFIAFIDDNVEVSAGWARGLVDAARGGEAAAITIPFLLRPMDHEIAYCVGIALGARGRIWENSYGKVVSGRPPPGGARSPYLGAALLPAGLVDAVGRFDEGFHPHYGMIDYCLRAARKGWAITTVPRARAYIRRPALIRECMRRSDYIVNQARLMLKHYPLRQALGGTAGLIATILFDRKGKGMAGADLPDRFCRPRALAGIIRSVPAALAFRLAAGRRPGSYVPAGEDCTAPPPRMMIKLPAPEESPSTAPARCLMGVSDATLGRGWYELLMERVDGVPTINYRWMSKEATVFLGAEKGGARFFQLCLSPPSHPGMGRSLTVFYDGKKQGTIDIKEPGWSTYRLPVDTARDVVEITLEAGSVSPPEISGRYEDVSFMVAEASILEKGSPFLRPEGSFPGCSPYRNNSAPAKRVPG